LRCLLNSQRLTDRLNDERKKDIADRTGIGLDIFSQYIFEYRKANGNLDEVDEQAYLKCLGEKRNRTLSALQASRSLRELWKPSKSTTPSAAPSTLTLGKGDDSLQFSIGRGKRRSTARRSHLTPIRSSTRSPRKSRSLMGTPGVIKKPQQFLAVEEYDDGYLVPSEDESSSNPFLTTPTKSPRKGRSSLSSVAAVPTSSMVTPSSQDNVVTSTPLLPQPEKELETNNKMKTNQPSSEGCRWDSVQGWSRRQIEKTVKRLADQMYHANTSIPSPKEVSEFIEAAFRNPSAQIIVPQLVSELFVNIVEYI
jgi:hypothetical protein